MSLGKMLRRLIRSLQELSNWIADKGESNA